MHQDIPGRITYNSENLETAKIASHWRTAIGIYTQILYRIYSKKWRCNRWMEGQIDRLKEWMDRWMIGRKKEKEQIHSFKERTDTFI